MSSATLNGEFGEYKSMKETLHCKLGPKRDNNQLYYRKFRIQCKNTLISPCALRITILKHQISIKAIAVLFLEPGVTKYTERVETDNIIISLRNCSRTQSRNQLR